jgi:hypothetical protein
MISCSSSAQYARCSLQNELFVTRALFPEVPAAIEDNSPLNLQVLLAVEQAKSRRVAQRIKAQVREAENASGSDDGEPEIPHTAVEDWEESFHQHLTEQLRIIGLSATEIHFMMVRYGEYFIEHRVMFGTHPSATDLKRKFWARIWGLFFLFSGLIRILPHDDLDLSHCTPTARNWLVKYQARLPVAITRDDVTSLQQIHHYSSVLEEVDVVAGASVSQDSVFERLSEEPSSGS